MVAKLDGKVICVTRNVMTVIMDIYVRTSVESVKENIATNRMVLASHHSVNLDGKVKNVTKNAILEHLVSTVSIRVPV